ncbi:hypothetical protein CsSME_00049718 [Camellia sinensis var. sinensis]
MEDNNEEIHKVNYSSIYLAIDPENEVFHHIIVDWVANPYGSMNNLVKVSPSRPMIRDRLRVRKILGTPDYVPLPNHPKSFSMKLVVWNCRDRRGGIWVIWDPVQVTVRAFEANDQVIHAKIKRDSYPEWILYSVYASPNPMNKALLWDNLEAMANNMTEPWLVAGDFNDIASNAEKRSPHLTWSNGRQSLANTLERLDRAVCNSEWRVNYPEAAVKNLPRTYSDHCPMVIYTQVSNQEWAVKSHVHFSAEDNVGLNKFISNMEIWKALKCIKTFKAPGYDEFQSVFYHSYWDIVGESVCGLIRNCFSSKNIPLIRVALFQGVPLTIMLLLLKRLFILFILKRAKVGV